MQETDCAGQGSPAHRELDSVGEATGSRPKEPFDDLRVQAPRPVESLPWLVWTFVTAVVAYGALVLLAWTGNFIIDPCDRLHESAGTALSWLFAAGSIFVSLVLGPLLLTRRQLPEAYAAGVLQALIWYWMLVIPRGIC